MDVSVRSRLRRRGLRLSQWREVRSARFNLIDRFQPEEAWQRALDYGGSSVSFAHFLLASADAVVEARGADRRAAIARGVMRR